MEQRTPWVKLAELMPLYLVEALYAAKIKNDRNDGRPAYSCGIAFSAIISRNRKTSLMNEALTYL